MLNNIDQNILVRRRILNPVIVFIIMTMISTSLLLSGLSRSKYVLNKQYLINLQSYEGLAIESVGAISGTTRQYETLTAGLVSPAGATYTLQWQRGDSALGPWENILNATDSTYTLTINENNHYIRVKATGTGDYTGAEYSPASGPVVVAATPIIDMEPISGNPYVGEVLTAGALTPLSATATWKWYRGDSLNGTFTEIVGAVSTTYTLTEDDLDKFIKVTATGSGTYSQSVSRTIGKILTYIVPIVSVEAISGTASEGLVLTAGAAVASDNTTATVHYQWQRSDAGGTVFTDITGATGSTYTVTHDDLGLYIRVKAEGYGMYSGILPSASTGPVTATPSSISKPDISGTPQVLQTLTASVPSGQTATFKWLISADGTSYSEIAGATSSTYTIKASDYTNGYRYITVRATGSGNYTGTLDSDAAGPITQCPITSITNISGTAKEGQTVSAGTVLPSGATVNYEWRRYASADVGGTYTIVGTNSAAYTLSAADVGQYIRVAVTGTGAFSGSKVSAYIQPVSNATSITNLSYIGDITGSPHVFETLTAGTVFPYGATATYQWQRYDALSGTYVNIQGATSRTYTTTGSDKGTTLIVVATGSGIYTGTVSSNSSSIIEPSDIVAVSAVSGTTTVGSVLTAGAVSPYAATYTFQWQRSTDNTGTAFVNISEATAGTYSLTSADDDRYIRLAVSGIGLYSGTVYSSMTGPATTAPIQVTAVGAIGGNPQVGQTLTAGSTTPAGATVTYQWQRANAGTGPFTDIAGATSSTYKAAVADLYTSGDTYIRLNIKGSGKYYTALPEGLYSAATSKITACPLVSVSNTIGKAEVGQVLTAGTVTPYGANVTYQWQRYQGGAYTNITGETSNTYTITMADNTLYVRVVVSAGFGYSGTVNSNNTGPVGSPKAISSISAITGITKVGRTLTAGTVLPYGSSVGYQWYRSSDNITYSPLSGASGSTYILQSDDYDKYIRVYASGTGDYFGEVSSVPTDKITKGTLISISPITGSTISGYTLTAGTISPIGATVDYQWLRYDSVSGNYVNISGATSSTYVLMNDDVGKTIKVKATGKDKYDSASSVTSAATAAVSGSGTTLTSITAISATTGTARVGETLTAGTVSAGATSPVTSVTYQWQRSNSSGGYDNIAGATSSTYVLTKDDYLKNIRPSATGTGTYKDTVYPANATAVSLQQSITAIANITGTPNIGSTLVAGAVTPSGATVSYQWQISGNNSFTNFTDISGAVNPTYTITNMGNMEKRVIRVAVTGTGAFTGTVYSFVTPRIGVSPTYLTAISPITGTAQVAQVLTAGVATPYGTSVTYQWLRKHYGEETYSEIVGATGRTYTTTADDYRTYIKVVATGAGPFSGWVESEPTGLIAAAPLTGISGIIGTTASGQTLAAGTVFPLGATVTYQWKRSNVDYTAYTDIEGATSSTYVLTAQDVDRKLLVTVTGYGAYTGTQTSAATGPVTASSTSLTSMGAISGTVMVNFQLTAGTVSAGAVSPVTSVTYQWYKAVNSGGPWTAIYGAVNPTYTITPEDYTQGYRYIKVTATGAGAYSGTVENASVKGPIAAFDLTTLGSMSNYTGLCNIGQTIVTGTVSPSNATFYYSWELSKQPDKNYAQLGANTESIVINSLHVGDASSTLGGYLRVTVTGTGAFTGSLSMVMGPIGPAMTLYPLTSIGPVAGTASPTYTLTAGTLTPNGATVSYQWQRSLTADGTYNNIIGATASSYAVQSGDIGYYIKVIATGINSYTGVVVSAPRGPVVDTSQTIPITAISDIIYQTEREVMLRSGTVTPLGAEVTYQWQASPTTNPADFSNIPGATAETYTIPIDQALGYYFKVVATGTGMYTGTVISNLTGPVVLDAYDLISVELNGEPMEGQVISAVNITAELAAAGLTPTVTYQWQISTSTGAGAEFTDIYGATNSSYTPTSADYNYYLRVKVTGSGAFEGTVYAYATQVVTGVMSLAQLTMAAPSAGAMPQTAAQVEAINLVSGYTVTGLTWNEPLTAGGKFKAGTVYTASIALTSKASKVFNTAGVTASVASAASVSSVTVTGSDVGNTVQFTVTFAQTAPLEVTGIAVKTQPVKLSYTAISDDVLSLLGLVVTETNNDGTTADITFTDGTAAGYSASPAHGTTLTDTHHGTGITITHTASGSGVDTSALTVQAPPKAESVSISGTSQVGQTLTGSYTYSDVNGDLEGTSTYKWYADDVAIDGATSLTYLLTAAEQGKTIKFEVTPVALTGSTTGIAVQSAATEAVVEEEP